MTDEGEPFRARLQPRIFENVCVLAMPEDFDVADLPSLSTGAESMVAGGIRGFVLELNGLYRLPSLEEGLGLLVRCIPVVYQKGGILNWLHGARFAQEWRRLELLGIPPENFETEREAIDALKTALKAARIRMALVERLANCGVSATRIAGVAGLFEADVRRIAAGLQEPSDDIALLIWSAIDSLSLQDIPARKSDGAA